MVTKIGGTTGIEFPDTTVQGSKGLPANGPCFSAYQGTSQTPTSSTETKIVNLVEDFDTNNCFDASRFTPNVAGYYYLTGCISGGGLHPEYASIFKNGAVWKRGLQFATDQTSVTVSCLVYLNGTTDYVELYFFTGTGAATNINLTWFQGHLVRLA